MNSRRKLEKYSQIISRCLHDGRDDERDHLSGGHDDGENNRAEFPDGVKNEQLPGRRSKGQG